MVFQDEIKMVRKQLGLSQEAIAEALCVSFATVNRWERGRTKPTLLAQKALADFCIKNNVNLEKMGE